MDSTSVSLLRRLKQPEREEAWNRFVELYAPLIFHWGTGRGLNPADAADLVQEVMQILAVELPKFEYDPAQRFRGWLRTITLNKARDLHRRKRPTSGMEPFIEAATAPGGVDLFEESEYRNFLVNRALEIMKAEFQEHTWRACLLLVDGMSGAEVAKALGIKEGAAYVAKSRVLRRLREELEDLLD
ncbi:MAG: sigma-70 family RNA polymerase sigma factor [Planctomycetales bacterium]|nr:sigma-70 family RNA polymerase sigma factor [Planctomycetales bacterium]